MDFHLSIRVTCNYKTIKVIAKMSIKSMLRGRCKTSSRRKVECAMTSRICFLGIFFHQKNIKISRGIPPKIGVSQPITESPRRTLAAGARGCKLKCRKEKKLSQGWAVLGENERKSESANVFARIFFSISRLHFYFHHFGYCY